MVFDVALDELGGIVCFVIEADDVSDSKFLEDGDVIFGGKGSVLNKGGCYSVFVSLFIGGRAEGDKFVGEDPVQIPVLYLLVVFVFRQVEGFVVEPAQLDCVLYS